MNPSLLAILALAASGLIGCASAAKNKPYENPKNHAPKQYHKMDARESRLCLNEYLIYQESQIN